MATEKRMMCVDVFKKNLCHYCNTYMSDEPCEPGECWVHDVIAQTDTVDAVEVVHGRWEDMSDKYDKGKDLRCSVCHRRASNFVGGSEEWWDMWEPFYCPNCGAKMDGK